MAIDDTADDDATLAGNDASSAPRGDRLPIVGDRVGRYVVESTLGSGGMGVVLAARDPDLDRRVAIKLLHEEAHGDSRGRAMLLREAQALAKLSHPNVVAVNDVGEWAGRTFIAMELVDGPTLRAWLDAQPRSIGEVLQIFTQCGEALSAAHDAGLVHRDFKPENVIVAEDRGRPRARVLDFGIASLLAGLPAAERTSPRPLRPTTDALASLGTTSHAGSGTPAYMAPEQHLGQRGDARVDQFAFCVALHEALYGSRPFAGTTLAALVTNVTLGDVVPAPPGSRVPRHLRAALLRGLRVDARARWSSMHALLAALGRDPRRTRRRVLVLASVALVAGGAAVVPRIQRARGLAACEREDPRLAQEWNATRRDAIAGAFAATGAPLAQETWARNALVVDDWLADFSTRSRSVCEGAVTESLDPAQASRARACLERAVTQVFSMLQRFESPDTAAVNRSAVAVQSLPRLEPCEDVAGLARDPVPPVGVVAAVDAVHARLSRASGLRLGGAHEAAQAEAEAAMADAESIGWQPLVAEAALAMGSVLLNRGRIEDARREMERAYFLGEEHGHPLVALHAAVNLTYVVGYRLSQPEEGLRWHARAEARIERLGLTVHPVIAKAYNHVSAIHLGAGRLDEALATIVPALAQWEAIGGPTHHELAVALNNLGILLSMRGDPRAALGAYERATEIRNAIYGPMHFEHVGTLSNLAGAYRDLDRPEEALAALRRAERIALETQGEEHPDLPSILNNIGGVLQVLGRSDEALPPLQRALELRERALPEDDPKIADALEGLGSAQHGAGNLQQARRTLERALRVRELVLDEDHPDIAGTLDALAAVREDLGDAGEAEALRRRAADIRARAGAR